jgi:hypothetical protein
MSLIDGIKSTLLNDLKIVEADAHQIATDMIAAGEKSFSAILDAVLPKAKTSPIGEILTGVFEIYKKLHAETA